MRLKQLLGTILLATVITAPAQGAVSQLGGVQVEPKDHASAKQASFDRLVPKPITGEILEALLNEPPPKSYGSRRPKRQSESVVPAQRGAPH